MERCPNCLNNTLGLRGRCSACGYDAQAVEDARWAELQAEERLFHASLQESEERRRREQEQQEHQWRKEGLNDLEIECRWDGLRKKREQEAKIRAERIDEYVEQLREERRRERAKNTLVNNVNSYGLFGLATWAVRGVAAGLSEAMKEAAASEAAKKQADARQQREAATRKPPNTVACPRCGRGIASRDMGLHVASCQAGEWERSLIAPGQAQPSQPPIELARKDDATDTRPNNSSPLSEAVQLSCAAHDHYRQQRYAEAKPLYEKALAIYEKQHGPDYEDTVIIQWFLAEVKKGLASSPLEWTSPSQADKAQRGWNGSLPEVPHTRHGLPIGDQWYVWTPGLVHPEGPLSKEEMLRRIDSGEVKDDAFCWQPPLATFRYVFLVRRDGQLGPVPRGSDAAYAVASQQYGQLIAKKIPALLWVEAGRVIESPTAEDIRPAVQAAETLILGLEECRFIQCSRITYEEPFCYVLEFQDGSEEFHYEAVDRLILGDRVANALCKYVRRDLSWRSDFEWRRVALESGPTTAASKPATQKAKKKASKSARKKRKGRNGGK